MKIINLCVGKRPPVIRMLSGERKVVCYEFKRGKCELVPDVGNTIALYITNMVRPNECKYTFPMQSIALCRVYSDNYSSTWREEVQNDKLKVELPQLSRGYYYLEITYEGSKNVTMLNIL